MVSKDDKKYVIWPLYFDRNISRHMGRKVSLKQAVDKPLLENIMHAAKSLQLNPVVEKNSAHPSHHWKKNGRILIDKKEKKTILLKKIAEKLRQKNQ